MSIQAQIQAKLTQAFAPTHLVVENESGQHAVAPGSESHFKVILVSQDFIDQSLLARHKSVQRVLAEELAGLIHALALHTYTPAEWSATGQAPASPACRGGDRRARA